MYLLDIGQTLHVPMPDGSIAAQVTETIFFDEAGDRING